MVQDKGAIFDMDGVICHTNPFHSEAFRIFFQKRGFIPTEEEFALHMYGKNNRYIFSHFLQRPVEGEELLRLEDEKESLFREIYREKMSPLPGLMPFLTELKSAGYRLAVATSAPYPNLEMIIDGLNIRHFFDSILTSEDVQRHKPDPEVYIKSALNLGLKPEHCVVFEDSYSGVSAGLSAGAKVVGLLTSHTRDELPECSRYINHFEEITVPEVEGLFN